VHELPIFCALDDIQPARQGVLGDYNFVHRVREFGVPVQRILPYHGAAWYWRAECEWMLDTGILVSSDFLYTLTASVHVPPAFLAERLRRLDQLWEESQETVPQNAAPSKHALNSLFGIWSIQTSYSYRLFVAETPGDVVEKAVRKTPTQLHPGTPLHLQETCVHPQ
jgi:hypothetical protein